MENKEDKNNKDDIIDDITDNITDDLSDILKDALDSQIMANLKINIKENAENEEENEKEYESNETVVSLIRVSRKDKIGPPSRLIPSDEDENEDEEVSYQPDILPKNIINIINMKHNGPEIYDLQFKIDNPKKSIYSIINDLKLKDSIVIEEIIDNKNCIKNINLPGLNRSKEDNSILLWVACKESDIDNTIKIVNLVSN